ncbi:hypothetical protein B0H34DRAFT_800993 [Crassisporium funariophilum]|nr:hypothetical protein B0H34DRAFT_800993 [Crassisporium funariophilum]
MQLKGSLLFSTLAFTAYALAMPAENNNIYIAARAGPAKACGDPRNTVPLLRAYKPGTDHFYTTDAAEMTRATSSLGYIDEGTTGYVFANQEPQTVPLYRTYSNAALDHFYTADLNERNNAISNLGYSDEGVVGYVYSNTNCGALPLFREYSNAQTDHFYTMSAAERDNASSNLRYTQEGISGFIFPF